LAVISVVIPAYNAGGFIKRTIDSVLAQTYRDYEVIVVDDGSMDNTADIVRSYAGKVRYIYQENAGDGPARNTGIRAAKGDWIAFLDHDDEWLPQKLELQIRLLHRNPDLRWCGANYYRSCLGRRDAVGNVTALQKALAGLDYFENFFTAVGQKDCSLITTTMVVHKDVFEQAGLFDSCWLLCADFDMWWRIAYSFPRIGYLAQPLAMMHLDALDIAAARRHLAGKRGEDARKLVARHLKLAQEQGMLAEFTPLAKKVLRKSLVTTIYHGFKPDARAIIQQFAGLLPWYWRAAAYILTIFPRATALVARSLTYLGRKLRLDSQVTRRQVYAKSDSRNYASD
jgi:glycosyltransferase involved in cell wall biosynthesis